MEQKKDNMDEINENENNSNIDEQDRVYKTNIGMNWSSIISSRIKSLILATTKKNWESHFTEINKLVTEHGDEVILYLLKSIIDSSDLKAKTLNQKDQARLNILQKINLPPTVIHQISTMIYKCLNNKDDKFFEVLMQNMKLTINDQIIICLSALYSPDKGFASQAINFLKQIIPTISNQKENVVTLDVFHQLLFQISQSAENFPKKEVNMVDTAFKKFFPNASKSSFIQPLRNVSGGKIVNSKLTLEQAKDISNNGLLTKLEGNSKVAAELMEDIGYSACFSASSLKDVLAQCLPLKELDVAMIIGMMARTHTGQQENFQLYSLDESSQNNWETKNNAKTWNTDIFVDTINEMYKLDWNLVIDGLDHPLFQLYDQKGFNLIISVYKRATKNAPFPVKKFFTVWKNSFGLLSVLKLAVNSPPDFFSFGEIPFNINEFPDNVKSAVGTPEQHWFSLSLIETLFDLSNVENYSLVRLIFDHPIEACPEILFLSIAQIIRKSFMRSELCNTLSAIFLSGKHPNSDFVLHKFWHFGSNTTTENPNKLIIINGMYNQYLEDKTSLDRFWGIVTATLGGLMFVLEFAPIPFALELACLGHQKGFFQDIEVWYRRKLMNLGNTVIKPTLELLFDVFERKKNPNQLKNEALTPYLNVLGEHAQQVQGPLLQELKKLKSSISEQPLQFFPRAIEERANNYFLQIYRGQLSIKNAIEILIQFQNSHDKRDQDTFACMIRSLFDEYKFFPKYPEKELKITGILFGQLIQNQLLNYLPLEIALRYVIEALRKSDNQNMFNFGFSSLEQFKSRLCEWPQYCALLLQIPTLKPFPQLLDYIETSMIQGRNSPVSITIAPTSLLPPSNPSPLILVPESNNTENFDEIISPNKNMNNIIDLSSKKDTPTLNKPTRKIGIGGEVSYDQLLVSITPVAEPDEGIKNKITFICNSLVSNNIELKVKEFLECGITEEFLPYFARYIISKRVSQKTSFHNEYLIFLDKMNFAELPKLILKETINNINVLLNAEEQSSHQRTLLKNLGFWLGMITLERDKPIRHRDLPLKQIILDAYEQGKLFAVIPFVVNIFSRSLNSKIFKVPNVWLMAHVSLLAEIWKVPDLKFTIKHTIETLLKSLGILLKSIQPSNLLINKTPNYGKNSLDWAVPEQQIEVNDEQKLISIIAPLTAEATISNLKDYIKISSNFFKVHHHLRRYVLIAIDTAIREAIGGIVERSYTIALCATKELITQDFSTELDENKMRIAAISMCQNLSANIAGFSARFHLGNSISKFLHIYLENEFKDINQHLQQQIDQAVNMVKSDNLLLACAVIEKATTERAIREIDESLAIQYQKRLLYKMSGQTEPFRDNSVIFPQNFPQILSPQNNGIFNTQMKVYENFGVIGVPSTVKIQYPPLPQVEIQRNDRLIDPLKEIGEALTHIVKQLDQIVLTYDQGQIPKTEINNLARQVTILFAQQPNLTQQLALSFVRTLFHRFFDVDNTLFEQVQIVLFRSVKEVYNTLIQEVITSWLTTEESLLYIKAKPALVIELLKFGLVLIQEFDMFLSKSLEKNPKVLSDLSYFFIKSCMVEPLEGPFVDLTMTLMTLKKIPLNCFVKVPDDLKQVLSSVPDKIVSTPFPSGSLFGTEIPGRTAAITALQDWLAGYQQMILHVQSTVSDVEKQKQLNTYYCAVYRIKFNSLLSSNASLQSFFLHAIDLCVESIYPELISSPNKVFGFTTIDALLQLVFLIVRFDLQASIETVLLQTFTIVRETTTQKDLEVTPQQLQGILLRLSAFLNSLLTFITRDHEVKTTFFNQRIYLRIFSLINLLIPAKRLTISKSLETQEEKVDESSLQQIIYEFQVAMTFQNALLLLSPSRFPGFAMAWLQLISHKKLMPALLLSDKLEAADLFKELLKELFKFLEPFLKEVPDRELGEPVKVLYNGTLRVLLVLLSDFPEFLCDFHSCFCDYIPHTAVQLRNLILSAYPKHVHLPEPLNEDLKVDRLEEIHVPPRILYNYLSVLEEEPSVRAPLDLFLGAPQEHSQKFFADLRQLLLLSPQHAFTKGTIYNIPRINALVLYLGVKGVETKNPTNTQATFPQNVEAFEVLKRLVTDLDNEGRYYVLNAIANQLRFPNKHTYYFSCAILCIFASTTIPSKDTIKNQIIRVLMERLIVSRPHPWGLMITFIELVKNDDYDLKNCSFTRCAPEIEKLYLSIESHIRGSKN